MQSDCDPDERLEKEYALRGHWLALGASVSKHSVQTYSCILCFFGNLWRPLRFHEQIGRAFFVFIVLLVSFRSLPIAFIAFLPMGLSWYVVQGIMGIFGLQFNLINIIIATFIFGIGVDYSIFVMTGLISKVAGEGDNLLTYHKTAIFFSAFVLMVVTGSLLFAIHPAIHSIGISTLIGMSATILITYTLQPALFRYLMKFNFFSKRFRPHEKK